MRKPFQGLRNVLRFNWPYFAVSLGSVAALLVVGLLSDGWARVLALALAGLIGGLTLLSLAVTLYVYDLSAFYQFNWLNDIELRPSKIVNVNAGFDETSELLAARFTNVEMIVCDFYDPAQHTAGSIRRARAAYPSFPGTIGVETNSLPIPDNRADAIFAIMSAHEIRDNKERTAFFEEFRRTLAPAGRIIVIEHIRDAANIAAYNLGAFHFHSRRAWLANFAAAGLSVETENKVTPFLTVFVLRNGTES